MKDEIHNCVPAQKNEFVYRAKNRIDIYVRICMN